MEENACLWTEVAACGNICVRADVCGSVFKACEEADSTPACLVQETLFCRFVDFTVLMLVLKTRRTSQTFPESVRKDEKTSLSPFVV